MIQDLRYGLRSLVRDRRLTLAAISTFALGIGLNAAMFTLVDSIVLRPLPFPDSDRLVSIWGGRESNPNDFLENTYQDFEAYQDASSFSAVTAFSQAPRNLIDPHGPPLKIQVGRVSGNLLGVLETAPIIGRGMTSRELGQVDPVALLDYGIWQDRYGASEEILGQVIQLAGESFTVIGVMPKGFSYPTDVSVWRPLDYRNQDDDRELQVVARLDPGSTLDQVRQEVELISQRLQQIYPEANAGISGVIMPLQRAMTHEMSRPLFLLWLAVSLVLVIACINIASLLLARSEARANEISVRMALGAGRSRIVRQSLTETLLLSLLGGGLGLGLAAASLQTMISWLPTNTPRLYEVVLDLRTLALLLTLVVLVGAATGLVPALRLSRVGNSQTLGSSLRTHTRNFMASRFQFGLITVETALSAMLLIGAGLSLHSLLNLLTFDRGFRSSELVVAALDRSVHFESNVRMEEFYQELSDQISQLPGVVRVAVGPNPMQPLGLRIFIELPGQAQTGALPLRVVMRAVSPDYFETAAISLLAGRGFTRTDHSQAERVAIVTSRFVARYLPELEDEQVINSRILSHLSGGNEPTQVRVIGISDDLRQPGNGASLPAIYFPRTQLPFPGDLLIQVRNADFALLESVRQTVRRLQPQLGVNRVEPIESLLAETLSQPRLNATLVSLFGLSAILLSAVGIYGVVSFVVVGRWKELAIRQALGAGRGQLLGLSLVRTLRPVLLGSTLGLIGAWYGSEFLRPHLFQVDGIPPFLVLLLLPVLLLVGILAGLMPAWRGCRVTPLSALPYKRKGKVI